MQLFELRLKIGSNQTDAVGKFWMQINESAGQNWRTQCVISFTSGANPQLKCDVQGGEYNTNFVALKYDTWYNIRMALDPSSMEFSYSLDGQQIGNVVPPRSNTLLAFTPGIGIANQGKGALNIVYIDYARISPLRVF